MWTCRRKTWSQSSWSRYQAWGTERVEANKKGTGLEGWWRVARSWQKHGDTENECGKFWNTSKKMPGGTERERERGGGVIDYRRQSPFSLCSAGAGESRESKVAQSSLLPRSLNGWRSSTSPPLATAATGLRFSAAAPLPKQAGAPHTLLHSPLSFAPPCLTSRHSPGGCSPPYDPLPQGGASATRDAAGLISP